MEQKQKGHGDLVGFGRNEAQEGRSDELMRSLNEKGKVTKKGKKYL